MDCHFLLQGNLPDPGFKPTFLALADAETPGKPYRSIKYLTCYKTEIKKFRLLKYLFGKTKYLFLSVEDVSRGWIDDIS